MKAINKNRNRRALMLNQSIANKNTFKKRRCVPYIEVFDCNGTNDMRYVLRALRIKGVNTYGVTYNNGSLFFGIENKGYFYLTPKYSLVHNIINDKYYSIPTEYVNFFCNNNND